MKHARIRFYVVLTLFVAWVIGLGVMASTSADKPRTALPAAPLPRSE